MIKLTVNVGKITNKLLPAFKQAVSPNGFFKDKLVRSVAISIGGDIKVRVHQDGIKSDGTPIGTYENPYLKLRQEKYNRTDGTKMIFSLTRQMENDFAIVSTDPIKTASGYGLGFKNQLNADKADWLQNGQKASTVKEYERRTKNGKAKVKSHSRKSVAGKGQVYKPTTAEIEKISVLANAYAKQFIDDLNA
jgi:hypothetical protein